MYYVKIHDINETETRITGYTNGVGQDMETELSLGHYIRVDEDVFLRVQSCIETKKIIYPSVVGVPLLDDVLLLDYPYIDEFKNSAIFQYKRKISNIMDIEFMISFYEFTTLNNKLSSQGYFITNENREEKYLEILNTGDIEYIELLEKYLTLFDMINQYQSQFTSFLEFKAELEELDDIEDIKELYTKHTYGDDLTTSMLR